MLKRTMASDVVRLSGPEPFSLVHRSRHHSLISKLASDFSEQIAAGATLHITGSAGQLGKEEVRARLALAARWSPICYQNEAKRFEEAYPESIEILPPDRYGDLVLLPALGCPNSTCTFCAFYQERRFRLLSDSAFSQHLDAVCVLQGESLSGRRGIFLGSASALSLGQRILLKRLRLVRDRLGERQRGVGAFWDPDHSPARSEKDWRSLGEAGLRSVYLGLETGLPSLRADIGKSPDIQKLLDRVEVARSAGLHIGVMILAGIGETNQFSEHCRASAEVVSKMRLSSPDIVFISPLLGSQQPEQLRSQASALRSAIAQSSDAKIAPYAAERFHYYA